MTAFTLQTLLLLGLAYFAGCAIACLLRRLMSRDAVSRRPIEHAMAPMQPTVQTAPSAVLTPPTVVRPPPVLAPANVQRTPAAQPVSAPVRDAFRRADTIEPVVKAPAAVEPPVPAAMVPPRVAGPRVVEPTSTAPAEQSNPSRFERALSAPQLTAPAAAPPAATPVAAPPVPRVVPQTAPPPVARPVAPPVQPAPVPPPQVVVAKPVQPAVVPAAAVTPPPVPTVAAAVVAAAVRPVQAAAAATVKPDDLKRIRSIDGPLETELNRLGARRYAEIALWTPEDVRRISQALGFKGRIEQENWIEQAQILARGEDTFYSRRLARGEQPSARPISDEGERKPSAPGVTVPTAPIPERPRASVEAAAAAAAALAAATSNRAAAQVTPAAPAPALAPVPSPKVTAEPTPAAVAPIARPMVEDRAAFARPAVQGPGQASAAAPPVARVTPAVPTIPSNPAPTPAPQTQVQPAPTAQPAVIAPTVVTPAAVRPAQPAPQTSSNASATVVSPAAAVGAAAAAAAAAAAGTAMARPAIGSGRDNLQRIGGISAEVERLLNVQGVTRYSQIGNWGPGDVERFDRLLGHQGRIQRENWIEQAQILAKGGDTAYSREHDRREAEAQRNAEGTRPARLADAIRPGEDAPSAGQRTNDLSTLRSVRSEGLRPAGAGARTGRPDDLKRVRGIGVLIEKKLNSMGISHYEQIANWTAGDIDRVSQALDFKGRIERENWVEQARILATGGQTEFSRRADREGEPEA